MKNTVYLLTTFLILSCTVPTICLAQTATAPLPTTSESCPIPAPGVQGGGPPPNTSTTSCASSATVEYFFKAGDAATEFTLTAESFAGAGSGSGYYGDAYCSSCGTSSITAGNSSYASMLSEWESLGKPGLYGTTVCSGATITFQGAPLQCPLKVNIAVGDATLDSEHGIDFTWKDRKGSKIIATSYGGLTPDEAWLVVDRDGTGSFVLDDGVINGDDFFTDQRHENGYQELFFTFSPFIKQDEQGRAYIPLHHVDDKAKAEEKEAAIARAKAHKGYERPIDPSLDLKLLDGNNNVLFASDYFSRIYVDYTKVKEVDKIHRDFILERGLVLDVNGNFHESADQWFVLKSTRPAE